MVVDKKYGFRVSGAAWYDNAYSSLDNRNNATANTLRLRRARRPACSRTTPRATRRAPRANCSTPSSSAAPTFGETDVSVRLGKHTVYWGESLLGGGAIHGISYGQYSLDLWKALRHARHRGQGDLSPAQLA